MHVHVTAPVALRSSKTEIPWMKVAWKITHFDLSCIFTGVFYELNSHKSKIVWYQAAVIGRAPMHLHCLHVNAYVVTQFRSRLDFGPARAAYNNDASVDRCIEYVIRVIFYPTCNTQKKRDTIVNLCQRNCHIKNRENLVVNKKNWFMFLCPRPEKCAGGI